MSFRKKGATLTILEKKKKITWFREMNMAIKLSLTLLDICHFYER